MDDRRYRRFFASAEWQFVGEEETELYAIAVSKAGARVRIYDGGRALPSFFDELITPVNNEEGRFTEIIFENFQFYGWFFIEYFLKVGMLFIDPSAVIAPKKLPEIYFSTSIIDGTINSIFVKFKDFSFILKNTKNICGLSADDIEKANGFENGLKYLKIDRTHKENRKLTEEEYKNISKRVLSLQLFFQTYKIGTKTIATNAINDFGKDVFEEISEEDDDILRAAYTTGFLWCEEDSKRRIIKNGWNVDRRSAYASIIQKRKLPYKLIEKGNGEPPKEADINEIIIMVYATVELKPGAFPAIQRKNPFTGKVCAIEKMENMALCITEKEFNEIHRYYFVSNVVYCFWWRFALDYIDKSGFVKRHYMRRQRYKEKGNPMEAYEKRMLTNIVGKFATKKMIMKDVPRRFEEMEGIKKYGSKAERIFVPASIYINSILRLQMLEVIYRNPGRLLYIDTDGMIFAGEEPIEGMKIGNSIGSFKAEKVNNIFIVSQKVYQYEKDGKREVKAAGIPYEYSLNLDLSKMKPGETIKAKIAKRCKGGAMVADVEKVVVENE